jgi:hypothetical protein
MKRIEAAVSAFVHASTLAAAASFRDGSEGVELNSDYDWLLPRDSDFTTAAREKAAERLFDYALKYKYGPEVLYRQQEMWLGRTPLDWLHVDDTLRIRYALFHSSANALASFIEVAPAAEPERQAETRSHGFEQGFDDEGEGRGQKIGDERIPSSPVAVRQHVDMPLPDNVVAELPRESVYRCEKCASRFTTVDVDHGVTPFMTRCKVDGCDGMAQSSMYPKAPRPSHVAAPSFEWYRPVHIDELADLSPATLDHLKRGGLLLRPRTDREPVKHGGEEFNNWDEVARGVDALFGTGTTAGLQAEAAERRAALAAAKRISFDPVTGAVLHAGNTIEAIGGGGSGACHANPPPAADLSPGQDQGGGAAPAHETEAPKDQAEPPAPEPEAAENVTQAIDPEGEHDPAPKPGKGKRRHK